MNYIAEIKAFYDLALSKPLSTGQIALWHALMHVNNKRTWIEWFTVPNQMLELITGLSRSAILKSRNVLKQHGLIDFRPNGTKATAYKIHVMSNSTQDGTQDGVQDGTQDGVQNSTPLNKLNKTYIPPLPPKGEKPNANKTGPLKANEPDIPANVPDDLRRALIRWWEYKRERRQVYKSAGWAALVQTAVKYAGKYGVNMVTALIEESMGNGYQGVIWDRLSRGLSTGSGGNKPGFNYQQHGYSPEALAHIGVNLFEEGGTHANADNHHPGQTAGT